MPFVIRATQLRMPALRAARSGAARCATVMSAAVAPKKILMLGARTLPCASFAARDAL
jgi:hypothetical protein